VSFGPQTAVEATFVASAASLVVVTALAVLPPGLLARARRRRDEDEPEVASAAGAPGSEDAS
jgi:hypothetical protein